MTTRGKSKDGGADKTLTRRAVAELATQSLHKLCEGGALEELQTASRASGFVSALNGKDVTGWTPLHAAAHGALANDTAAQCRVIRFLLQHGADPTITTSTSSNTVLHLLARVPIDKAEDGVISLLSELIIRFLEKGVKIDQPNAKQKSPLHVATSKSTVVLMAMLLQYGADPNARNHRGETPLHVAIGTADVEKVRILTNYRADPTIRAEYDMTPLDLAQQQGEAIMMRVMQFALKRAEERLKAEREEAEAAAKQLEVASAQLTDSGFGDIAPPDENALDSLVATLTDPDTLTQLPDSSDVAKEQEEWQEHRRIRQKMLPSSYQTPEQAAAALVAGSTAASTTSESSSTTSSASATASAAVSSSYAIHMPLSPPTSASSSPVVERSKGSGDSHAKTELRPKVLLRTNSAARNSPPGSPRVGGSPRAADSSPLGRESAGASKKDKLAPPTASKSRGGTLLTLLTGSFRGTPEGLRDAIKAGSEDLAPADEGEVIAGDSPDVRYAYNENGSPTSIRAATLDKLIERLTGQRSPGQFFVNCFLLTYRRFTSAQELLQKMFKRFHDKRHRETEQARQTVQYRVLALLRAWVEGFFEDFADNNEALKPLVMDFLQNQIQTPVHKVSAMNLQRVYDKSKEAYERARRDNQRYLEEISKRQTAASPRALNILEVNVKDIAYQMTLLESDNYCQLRSRECLNQNWNSKDKSTVAPNILRNIEHFNAMNRWVMSEIVSHIQLKSRQQALAKFIELARALRDLNNFNGLMEVLSGLRSAAVQRLAKTWEGLDSDHTADFQLLVKEMSFDGNFRSYRALLKTVGSPCLPYLGVYLTDLTFLEDGNPDVVDGLINFYKHEKIAEVVQQIQFFQDNRHQSRYLTLQRSPELVAALSNLRYMSEKEAYAQSLRVEPRDANEAIEAFLQEEIRMRAQIQDLQLQKEQSDALVRELKATVTQLTQKIKTLQSDLRVTRNIGHLALPDEDLNPTAAQSPASAAQARLDRASVRKSQMIAARAGRKPAKPLPAVPSATGPPKPPVPSATTSPATHSPAASSPAVAPLSPTQFLLAPAQPAATGTSNASARQDLPFLPPRPVKPSALTTTTAAAVAAASTTITTAAPPSEPQALPSLVHTAAPAEEAEVANATEVLRAAPTEAAISLQLDAPGARLSVGPPSSLPPLPPQVQAEPAASATPPPPSVSPVPSSTAVNGSTDSPKSRRNRDEKKEKKEKKSSRIGRSHTSPDVSSKASAVAPKPAADLQPISNTRPKAALAPQPGPSLAPGSHPDYEPPSLSTINRKIAANETKLFPYTRGESKTYSNAPPTPNPTPTPPPSPAATAVPPPTAPKMSPTPTISLPPPPPQPSISHHPLPPIPSPPSSTHASVVSFSSTSSGSSNSSGSPSSSRPASHGFETSSRRTHSGNYVIDVSDKPPPPRPPSADALQINPAAAAAPANVTSSATTVSFAPINNASSSPHSTTQHSSPTGGAGTAATSPFGKSRSMREPVRTPAFAANQSSPIPSSPSAARAAAAKYATVRHTTKPAAAAPPPADPATAKQGPRSISLRHFGVIKRDEVPKQQGGTAPRPFAADI